MEDNNCSNGFGYYLQRLQHNREKHIWNCEGLVTDHESLISVYAFLGSNVIVYYNDVLDLNTLILVFNKYFAYKTI